MVAQGHRIVFHQLRHRPSPRPPSARRSWRSA
jgi:hypothetical protein